MQGFCKVAKGTTDLHRCGRIETDQIHENPHASAQIRGSSSSNSRNSQLCKSPGLTWGVSSLEARYKALSAQELIDRIRVAVEPFDWISVLEVPGLVPFLECD